MASSKGPMRLRTALAKSRTCVDRGWRRSAPSTRRSTDPFRIRARKAPAVPHHGPRRRLGDRVQMARAYSVFANGGYLSSRTSSSNRHDRGNPWRSRIRSGRATKACGYGPAQRLHHGQHDAGLTRSARQRAPAGSGAATLAGKTAPPTCSSTPGSPATSPIWSASRGWSSTTQDPRQNQTGGVVALADLGWVHGKGAEGDSRGAAQRAAGIVSVPVMGISVKAGSPRSSFYREAVPPPEVLQPIILPDAARGCSPQTGPPPA